MTGNLATFDRTHDVKARSWVESANVPGNEFPVQNLPFGIFRRTGERGSVDEARARYVAHLAQFPAWRSHFAAGYVVEW